MNIKRSIPVLTATTLAILALAACSQDATVTPVSTASETTASAPATSAPAETEAPTETATAEFATGSAVADQAIIAACQPIGIGLVTYGDLAEGKCPLPNGSRLYPLGDGSQIVVNQDEALPEAVVGEVTTSIAPHQTMSGDDRSFDLARTLTETSKKTGRTALVVVKVTFDNGDFFSLRKAATEQSAPSVDGVLYASAAEANQAAQDYVGRQAHPDRWVVIPYAG